MFFLPFRVYLKCSNDTAYLHVFKGKENLKQMKDIEHLKHFRDHELFHNNAQRVRITPSRMYLKFDFSVACGRRMEELS